VQQGASDLITPTAARKANRIAWVNRVWDTNIYRASASGSESPVKLIASTQRDQNPAVSPDGRIAFVSDRSGSREIWIADIDGANQTKVTDLGGPPVGSLAWSPDGRNLAFDTRPHEQAGVFTMERLPGTRRCGQPQMLVPDASAPSWSSDGMAIFYSATRGAARQIWRHPLDGRPDTQMTRDGGYVSRQSADGKWLYFVKNGIEPIYRMSSVGREAASGAPPELVIPRSVHVQTGRLGYLEKRAILH
jgi:Tol biopolymer transport system component